MTKGKFFSILYEIPEGTGIAIHVVHCDVGRSTRFIRILCSRPCFDAAWTRTGRTSEKTIDTAIQEVTAVKKAEKYRRWMKEFQGTQQQKEATGDE